MEIFDHQEISYIQSQHKNNMSKILVTGATGMLGRKIIDHLLKRISANDIVALVRDAGKGIEISNKGVEVRVADYFDYGALIKAFEGVEKVLLIGSHSFTDRFTQHYNVITAARQAGVKHIVYNSIMRKNRLFADISDSDIFSEQTLKASGLTYTILHQPPFIEVLHFYYGFSPYEKGFRLTKGNGKMAPITRDDLAEAEAILLTTEGHENKGYDLTGSEAISFADIAKTLGDLKDQSVPYEVIPEKEYKDMRVAEGIPPFMAQFAFNWVDFINNGEYDGSPELIERLLGRKTMTIRAYLETTLELEKPQI
jgi:NAD(P)H dehydrogenase (quinone)